jgi:hypothetical protein
MFTLYAILFVCAAPLVIAACAYFFDWRPAGSTNYGQIVQPQRPVPEAELLKLTDLDGSPFDLRSLYGKWVLVSADTGACEDECAKKLFIMRQTHASTGKEIGRIERVWFITDKEPVPTLVIRAYEGMRMVRVDPEQLARFLALPEGETASPEALRKHIWLIDPRNNQMMRFPENPDPLELRNDIGELLKASRIG